MKIFRHISVALLSLSLAGCFFGGIFGSVGVGSSNLSAMGGDASILVQWTEIANANNYNLYKTVAIIPNAAAGLDLTAAVTVNQMLARFDAIGAAYGSVSSAETIYIDDGLTNGMVYCYIVTGVSEGETPPSNVVCQMPMGVAEITALVQSMGATLTWEAVPGAAGYNLYWKTVTPGIIPFASISSPGASLSASKLSSDDLPMPWDDIPAIDEGVITVDADPDAATVTYDLSTESNCLDVIAKVIAYNEYGTELPFEQFAGAQPQAQGEIVDHTVFYEFGENEFLSARVASDDRLFLTLKDRVMKWDPEDESYVVSSVLPFSNVVAIELDAAGNVIIAGTTESAADAHPYPCQVSGGGKTAPIYVDDGVCYYDVAPHIKVCRLDSATLQLESAGCFVHRRKSLVQAMVLTDDAVYLAGSVSGDRTGQQVDIGDRFAVLKLTLPELDEAIDDYLGPYGFANELDIIGNRYVVAVGDAINCQSGKTVCDTEIYRVKLDENFNIIRQTDIQDANRWGYYWDDGEFTVNDPTQQKVNVGIETEHIYMKDVVQLESGDVLTVGYSAVDRQARESYLWFGDDENPVEIFLVGDRETAYPTIVTEDCRGKLLIAGIYGVGSEHYPAFWQLDEDYEVVKTITDESRSEGIADLVFSEAGLYYFVGSVIDRTTGETSAAWWVYQ